MNPRALTDGPPPAKFRNLLEQGPRDLSVGRRSGVHSFPWAVRYFPNGLLWRQDQLNKPTPVEPGNDGEENLLNPERTLLAARTRASEPWYEPPRQPARNRGPLGREMPTLALPVAW